MSLGGFIVWPRTMLEWEWHDKPEIGWLYLTLLTLANFKPASWQGREIRRGQFVTSYEKLSCQTGLSVQSIRTALKKLKSTGYITCEPTNKYTVISLLKYEETQGISADANMQTNTHTNRQTTGSQQTTNNNVTIQQRQQEKQNREAYRQYPKRRVIDAYDRIPRL